MWRPKAEAGVLLYCSLFFNFQLLLIYLECLSVWVQVCHSTYMYGARGQHGGAGLLLPCRFGGSNSPGLVAKHLYMLSQFAI